MFRGDFLTGLFMSGASFCADPVVGVSQSPSPSPTTNPYEQCDRNYVLPYNQAIEFKHRALDAPDVDLTAYRGNVVLLNFFTTWCGPCNFEQPGLVYVANTYYDRGLRVVGVNCAESDEAVREYRKKYNIVYPIAMDGNGLIARIENNEDDERDIRYPATLFLNEQGMLTCYRKGAMHKEEIVYKVERMLSFLNNGGS